MTREKYEGILNLNLYLQKRYRQKDKEKKIILTNGGKEKSIWLFLNFLTGLAKKCKSN